MKRFALGVALAAVMVSVFTSASYALDKADCEKLYRSNTNDLAICKVYNEGVDAFNDRANQMNFDAAIKKLSSVEGKAQDGDLNFDVLILESRMAYWQGVHTSDIEGRKVIHLLGFSKAEAAKKVNDDYAESFFFAGINLARWAEANGIMASLGRKSELEANMKNTKDRVTRKDEDGASIDGYGPDRVLGRMNLKLKLLPGYSLETSIKYLSNAVAKSNPPVALNTLYLADSLLRGNSADKARARQVLTDLVSNNPRTFNPDRVPETVEEFALARDMLAGKDLP